MSVTKYYDEDIDMVVHEMDWDKKELDAVLVAGLPYAVRSSKYPRTLEHPSRVLLTINHTTSYSVHKILLKSFSTRLKKVLKSQPSLQEIHITGLEPITSLTAWRLFTTWLYMLDKVPLPDYTPLRPSGVRTRDLKAACFLSSFLSAPKFEKFLLRIIFKEVHTGRFSESHLWHLSQRMGRHTGMWHFSNAYFRWKKEGEPGELDPYRWRVEHWYSICGTVENWGCFHAMNTSGWGGVWERQALMNEKVEWIDEVLYDEPPGVDGEEGAWVWDGDVDGEEEEEGDD